MKWATQIVQGLNVLLSMNNDTVSVLFFLFISSWSLETCTGDFDMWMWAVICSDVFICLIKIGCRSTERAVFTAFFLINALFGSFEFWKLPYVFIVQWPLLSPKIKENLIPRDITTFKHWTAKSFLLFSRQKNSAGLQLPNAASRFSPRLRSDSALTPVNHESLCSPVHQGVTLPRKTHTVWCTTSLSCRHAAACLRLGAPLS